MTAFIGRMTITVERETNGQVSARHETELSPDLAVRQNAMNPPDRAKAQQLRIVACATVADFFLAIHNPASVEAPERPQS